MLSLRIQNVTMVTIVSAKISLTKKRPNPQKKSPAEPAHVSSTIPQDSRDHVCVGFPVGLLQSQ